MVKTHLTQQIEKVLRVTINGLETPFELHSVDKQAFPLSASCSAPDGDVVTVCFDADVNKGYEIKFFVK